MVHPIIIHSNRTLTPTPNAPPSPQPAHHLYGSLFDRKSTPGTEACSPVPKGVNSRYAPDSESRQHAHTPSDSKVDE